MNPIFINGYVFFASLGALLGHFAGLFLATSGAMLVGMVVGLLLWSGYGFIFGR